MCIEISREIGNNGNSHFTSSHLRSPQLLSGSYKTKKMSFTVGSWFLKKNVSLLRGKMIDVSLLSIENRSLSTWENHKFHFNNERLPILLTISKCFYQDFTVNLYTCFLRLNLSSVFLLLKKQYIYIERWGRSGYLFLECIHIYNGLSPHFRHMSVKQISS